MSVTIRLREMQHHVLWERVDFINTSSFMSQLLTSLSSVILDSAFFFRCSSSLWYSLFFSLCLKNLMGGAPDPHIWWLPLGCMQEEQLAWLSTCCSSITCDCKGLLRMGSTAEKVGQISSIVSEFQLMEVPGRILYWEASNLYSEILCGHMGSLAANLLLLWEKFIKWKAKFFLCGRNALCSTMWF